MAFRQSSKENRRQIEIRDRREMGGTDGKLSLQYHS